MLCFSRRFVNRGLLRARGYSSDKPTDLNQFTEEEHMIRDSVRRFANEIIKPRVRQMDEDESMHPDVIKGLFDNGLMGIEVCREHEGAGLNFMSSIIAIEELARVDPAVSILCDIHNTLITRIVDKYGSNELRKQFLPRLATKDIGSFCLSETEAGSDAFALKMQAEPINDDEFVLKGSKLWISNSQEAQVFLVFANVDLSKGYRGITCFLVERGEGVVVGRKESKLGIRASSTCSVGFDGVKVSKSRNMIGSVGQGYKIAIESLNEGRIGIAAQMLGLAEGVFESTLPYLFQRRQFNHLIGDFQAMQHQYAEIALDIETARLLTYNAARLKESAQPFLKEAAMAKLHASRVAERASSRCIEWLGGVGFTRDFPAEKFYRDCKIGAIYEGTNNIQLQTIAKAIKKTVEIK